MTGIITLAFTYVLTIWEAFAIKTLWAWFVATQFGLPLIGMAHAVGLALLASLFTHQAPSNVDDDGRLVQVLSWGAITPAVALAVGWIAKQSL